MVPKIIHYCWFGRKPLPSLALKCIASWKKYLPDYEIKEWNEDNFDVNVIPYTKEAYSAKKYAFVSDYARFWILYNYGGLYFDTDVELIKSIDDILANGGYMGFEKNPSKKNRGLVNPGIGFASEKNNILLKDLIDLYSSLHFVDECGNLCTNKTVVHYTTDILQKYGLNNSLANQYICGFTIYLEEYFSPISLITHRLHLTKNTRSIHRFMGSWATQNNSIIEKLRLILPERILLLYNKVSFSKKKEMFK